MSHLGRMAARVAGAKARQLGPALRSNSPIAEHDQRLTSFNLEATAVGSRDAVVDLEEATAADSETVVGSGGGALAETRRRGPPRQETRDHETKDEPRPRAATPNRHLTPTERRGSVPPPIASEAQGAVPPSRSEAGGAAPPRTANALGLARPPAAALEPSQPPGKPPSSTPESPGLRNPPAPAPQSAEGARPAARPAVAALASAFAQVRAWMNTPATVPPEPSSPAVIARRAGARGADLRPSRPLEPAGAWPADGAPSSTFAVADLGSGLSIGQLSIQVAPPPAPLPVQRAVPGAQGRRPDPGADGGPLRSGALARLGFGMRHW
jgi:hypothetical protein